MHPLAILAGGYLVLRALNRNLGAPQVGSPLPGEVPPLLKKPESSSGVPDLLKKPEESFTKSLENMFAPKDEPDATDSADDSEDLQPAEKFTEDTPADKPPDIMAALGAAAAGAAIGATITKALDGNDAAQVAGGVTGAVAGGGAVLGVGGVSGAAVAAPVVALGIGIVSAVDSIGDAITGSKATEELYQQRQATVGDERDALNWTNVDKYVAWMKEPWGFLQGAANHALYGATHGKFYADGLPTTDGSIWVLFTDGIARKFNWTTGRQVLEERRIASVPIARPVDAPLPPPPPGAPSIPPPPGITSVATSSAPPPPPVRTTDNVQQALVIPPLPPPPPPAPVTVAPAPAPVTKTVVAEVKPLEVSTYSQYLTSGFFE